MEDIEVVVHSDFEDMQRCMKGEDDYFKEEVMVGGLGLS